MVFAAFDPDTRRDVARLFEVRRADDNQTLIEAGKRSDGLYILIAGKVDYHGAEGAPSELGPVTVFGHDSLIARGAALCSVRTTSEVIVLRLPASSFGRLATEYPPVLAHLSNLASESGDQGVSQLR